MQLHFMLLWLYDQGIISTGTVTMVTMFSIPYFNQLLSLHAQNHHAQSSGSNDMFELAVSVVQNKPNAHAGSSDNCDLCIWSLKVSQSSNSEIGSHT